MNKRLQCIAELVPQGRGMIDVGTDHGYLPVYLLQHGYSGAVYASDIHKGPLQAAVATAEAAGLQDAISFQLCDGLDCCEAQAVDSIVIAGMGGDTICGILDRAEWCMDEAYTLVLQPMTRAEVLRYWLVNNEFEIVREELAEDGGLLYSALVARFGGKTVLNDAELYTGSFAMLHTHPLFPQLLELQMQRFEKMKRGLRQSEKAETPGRLAVIESVLSQLQEMKEHVDC